MRLRVVGACVLLAVLTACSATTPAPGPAQSATAEPVTLSAYLAELRSDAEATEVDALVEDGVAALERRDLTAASTAFNRALKLDPTNGPVHFLNGLTYHLTAARGDASQLEYARVGYELALKFNASDVWAAHQLGVLAFNQQNYDEAQEHFAYAALFEPDSVEVLAGLAAASYHAHDLSTALATLEKLLALAPEDTSVLRTAAMVHAALGNDERARGYAGDYAHRVSAQPFRARRLGRRLDEWAGVHKLKVLGADDTAAKPNQQLAQMSGSDVLGSDAGSTGLQPADSSGMGGSGYGSSMDSGSSMGGDSTADTDTDSGPKLPPKMTLIDVVIIRSEEQIGTSKGVNLLSGLQMTFSGTLFSHAFTKTVSTIAGGDSTVQEDAQSASLSVPSVTYSLNIFNDNSNRNEVLARPTLVALDGKTSDFFSGTVWHVELSSGVVGEASVEDVSVGIHLSVTPQFIDDEKVILNVSAARAFIEDPASEAGFTAFSQTSKTTVSANVVMDFEKTLVLSGLSEKETEVSRDGVPVLQDIPGLQYFFSRKDKVDFNKSVLILLTPRKPQFTYVNGVPVADTDADAKPDDKEKPALKELKLGPPWDFKPAPNLEAVMRHLADNRLFKEFRTGDVALETWDDVNSVDGKIRRTLEFLYY